MKSRLLVTVCASLFTLWINASAYAADYTFTKIFDTNDIIPGRSDTFTRFDTPSLDGRDIAFAGERNSDYSGALTYINGRFNVVADSTMPIPGGVGNFDTLEIPIIDNGNVVFVGTQNSGFEAHGIYTDLGGSLRVVADHNTPIPEAQVTSASSRTKTITSVMGLRHSMHGIVISETFPAPARGGATPKLMVL